jgi:hypothetical protein
MSDYTPKPGRGTLFKQGEDRPSAWSGKVTLPDGSPAYLDLYKATDRETGELRRDRDGNPFYNVTLKPIQSQSGGGSVGGGQDKPSYDADIDGDSIPF